MKKIIKTLLVVMVLVLALAAFTSCGTVIESFKHIGHDVMTLPAIAPTCAKEGLEEGLYCNDCHVVVVEQKTIAKLEHEMVPNEDRAPTCNLVGLQGGTHCKHCGLPNGEQVEVPVIDCIYGEPYVYQAPTCGVDGFYAMDCTMCGTAKKGDVIPATGEHSFTVDVAAKDPTCGADGYTAHKDCDVCGAHDEDYEVRNALSETGEHSFNEGEVTTAPTCTTAGVKTFTCSVCGETKTEDVAATGHTDANADAKCDACEAWILPEVGVAFQLKLYQANRDEVLYLNGAKDGNFLATTTDASAAVNLYLEAVEGGYYIYFMDGETKKYVDVYEWQTGSIGVTISEEPHGVWVWDADLGVLTVTMCERTVYLGTYKEFNTMSLSDTYRISGDKAGDVGVSQFVARMVVVPTQEPEQE